MKTVFLDRDGTINKEKHYLCDPAQVELLPNVASAIKLFNESNIQVVVLTNQSGIGRGYYTIEDYNLVNRRIFDLLAQENAFIDRIYYCPHLPEEACHCRKPKPGMIEQACKELCINLQDSFMIGDRMSDIFLGYFMKMKTIGVLTGYGKSSFSGEIVELDYLVNDLLMAAEIVIQS